VTNEMVWSHVEDGFRQISGLQEEEGMLETLQSIKGFHSTKGSGFVGCDMAGSH